VDAAPHNSSIGVRMRLTHASSGPANRSVQEIRRVIELAKTAFVTRPEKQAPDDGAADQAWQALLQQQAIQAIVVTTEELDDGAVDVIVSCAMPLDQLVKLCAGLEDQRAPSEAPPRTSSTGPRPASAR
jgi:hypothetical protein